MGVKMNQHHATGKRYEYAWIIFPDSDLCLLIGERSPGSDNRFVKRTLTISTLPEDHCEQRVRHNEKRVQHLPRSWRMPAVPQRDAGARYLCLVEEQEACRLARYAVGPRGPSTISHIYFSITLPHQPSTSIHSHIRPQSPRTHITTPS
jgi:hypothetical protein